MTTLKTTDTTRPIKIKIEFEIDPRDLTAIIGEIDFGFDREPGIREIRTAVKETIVQTGISRLLAQARKRVWQSEQLAETTDSGARKEQSSRILWCRSLIDKAFKPRKPYQRKQQTGQSLLDIL